MIINLKTYQMKYDTEITFQVKKNPRNEAIVKYYNNGLKRIIVEVTQEEMDKIIFETSKK